MKIKQQTNNWLGVYGDDVEKYHLIDTLKEKKLSKKIKKGDLLARNELVNANLRLVIKIARGYSNYGVCIEDLVSEGNEGLIVAANRFNGDMNVKFSVYASNWIKYYVRKAVIENSKQNKYNVKPSDVDDLHTIENFSEDETHVKEKELNEKMFSDVILEINALTPRESNIIKHYFGIDGCDEKNLNDLSKIYNISAMRVSKIIESSIRKIKSEMLYKMVK